VLQEGAQNANNIIFDFFTFLKSLLTQRQVEQQCDYIIERESLKPIFFSLDGIERPLYQPIFDHTQLPRPPQRYLLQGREQRRPNFRIILFLLHGFDDALNERIIQKIGPPFIVIGQARDKLRGLPNHSGLPIQQPTEEFVTALGWWRADDVVFGADDYGLALLVDASDAGDAPAQGLQQEADLEGVVAV
jgi:hypothetical protein